MRVSHIKNSDLRTICNTAMRKLICIETFPSYHHTDLEQGKNVGMLAFIFKTVVLSRAMMPMVPTRAGEGSNDSEQRIVALESSTADAQNRHPQRSLLTSTIEGVEMRNRAKLITAQTALKHLADGSIQSKARYKLHGDGSQTLVLNNTWRIT